MIADAAQPGDVIVISTHGYSGLKRWVLGSVAEKLIRLAGAPVIVMRSPEAPSDH
jgi:nucleotide-binding universal stress UspA family protein